MNSRRIRRVSRLAALCIVLLFGAPGQARQTCPRITRDMRPALLFVEGTDESNLEVAYRRGGQLRRERILSSKYLEVTPLDNAVFLVNATDARYARTVFALDFESGTIARIESSGPMRCLRAEPGRKSAMLVEFDRVGQDSRLIELAFGTLSTVKRQALSKAVLGGEYHPFKISPDFAHIAYVSSKGGTGVEGGREFELKSLDLKTFRSVVLDPNVRVQIPPISSTMTGFPPFEWISATQVLYQHMLPADARDRAEDIFSRMAAVCVFKIADIGTGTVSECFRKESRMELNGGSLATDPLTGRLILNDKYVFDYVAKQLSDRNLPFVVSEDWGKRSCEIRTAGDVVYSGPATCLETLLSRTGRSFSYVLRPNGTTLAGELFAVFSGDRTPVKVGEGTSAPTRPAGWIE